MSATSNLATNVVERDETWELRLYLAGQSPKSLYALSNLTKLCDEHLAGRYTIETVDLVEQPARARDDDVLAIPTLIRRSPQPVRRIIGDLSDTDRMLNFLRLRRAP